jgi:hypothetical protein
MIWMAIPGLEGYYSASTTGLIRRDKGTVFGKDGRKMNIPEKILKTVARHHGHLTVDICINSKHKPYFVHRLVAKTFIPNLKNKPFVNHIDNDPGNNAVDNLEWCTHQENMQHSLRQGRMVIPEAKTIEQNKLEQIKLLLAEGCSKREIARRLNVCRNTITKYCS